MNKLKSLLFASLLLALPVHAESEYSPKYTACMESVDFSFSKNAQWSACALAELDRVDAELNKEYKKLRDSLNKAQQNDLIKQQRAWLKYREERCAFEMHSPMAPGGQTNHDFCMLEMTKKKADYLKALN